MWDPQFRALSRDFNVVAVDLRGHGESPAPVGPRQDRWVTPRAIAYSSLMTESGRECSAANKTGNHTNTVVLHQESRPNGNR